MSTIIYNSPIFGPVHSRRLGVSLGVNLQPGDGKVCSFDCVYCECGFNADHRTKTPRPSRDAVKEALEATLAKMKAEGENLDVITFAGNGEPTGHPEFAGVIDDTLELRDRYYPGAKVSVLSNATFLKRKGVMEALRKVDNNIQKLDTVNDGYVKLIDRPQQPSYSVAEVMESLKEFNGHVIIQTMFMTGTTEQGISVDNTTDDYVAPWLEAVKAISPEKVMIYTIDRETPDHSVQKASRETLDNICERVGQLGIACTASY